MNKVFALRPQPGLAATLEAAASLGLEVTGVPLFIIGPVDWAPPPASEFDGLLIGSANAIRHAGEGLGHYRGKYAFCVGAATAKQAAEAGLEVRFTGEGGLQHLLDALPADPLRLLRLAGEAHVTLDPPPHIRVVMRVVYRASAQPLPDNAVEQLAQGGVVMLHSAAAAQHFANECARLAVDKATLHLAALGPRIAAAAGPGWGSVSAADTPREAALLALVQDLCHETH